MAGASIFGPGRILTSNATVSVQNYATSIDNAGGTVETYSDLVTGIEVLITLWTGGRENYFQTDAQTDRAVLAGVDGSLGRSDTRIAITDFPDMSYLVGTKWRVDSNQVHPAGRGGLLRGRVEVQISRVDFPITIT